jgi:UDP-glucose 6-dehydrogenase
MAKHGTHSYDNISRAKVEAIINALTAHGSIVTGYNPWSIDTRKHGVRLQGDWNEETSTLDITVTHADWYVPGKTLWENIDSLMSRVQDEG